MTTETSSAPDRDATMSLLDRATAEAARYLHALPERPVHAEAGLEQLRADLDVALQDAPLDAEVVFDELVAAASPGVVGTTSPRWFGFVIGGTLPITVAADWMTTVWDQNQGLYAGGPSASVVEEVVGRWLKDIFGLPAGASFALTTGCQMAHFTALAAARHRVLERAGWSVESDGLAGSPPIRLIVGESRHVTVDRAARLLGIGANQVAPVECDGQGRMLPEALRQALQQGAGPAIVSIQVGDVNTGAIDPVGTLSDIAHEAGAWAHVDGAFGLWAAASPGLREQVAGLERADSWATDAHKWLNVPYDSGLAFCADSEAHQAALGATAAYLIQSDETGPRDALNWTPEFSRRARGFTVYAALRSLGRTGVADLVDRCCAHARQFASLLSEAPGVEVLNEVGLNQVLVRFLSEDGNHDDKTREVIRAVQDEGTCWMSGTTWHGIAAMRISVSNWGTTVTDVERSVEAILRVAGARR